MHADNTKPSTAQTPEVDVLVVGGGFFGLYLAEQQALKHRRVVVCERETECMSRASYINQARVHNGYHYPRSILTAYRSRVNFPRFVQEFPSCIDRSFVKLYAIGRHFGKVTASQYRTFMHRIGAPTGEPTPAHRALFDERLIEDSFTTTEYAFDARELARVMRERVETAAVDVRVETEVTDLRRCEDGWRCTTITAGTENEVRARTVLICAYSGINRLLARSGLPVVPLKHEMTEMALVSVPEELRAVGITVMCGPFFSTMPFPPEGLHTLSHVRYTPHFHWQDSAEAHRDAYDVFDSALKRTAFPHMVRDAARYVPALADAVYHDSLWELKTILPRSEVDDGRPILFLADHGGPDLHVIMGGKIDNVYDAVLRLEKHV